MEAASLRLLSKNFPKLFSGFSELVGIGVPAMEKQNLSATLPLFKAKDLDLTDILVPAISLSSPIHSAQVTHGDTDWRLVDPRL